MWSVRFFIWWGFESSEKSRKKRRSHQQIITQENFEQNLTAGCRSSIIDCSRGAQGTRLATSTSRRIQTTRLPSSSDNNTRKGRMGLPRAHGSSSMAALPLLALLSAFYIVAVFYHQPFATPFSSVSRDATARFHTGADKKTTDATTASTRLLSRHSADRTEDDSIGGVEESRSEGRRGTELGAQRTAGAAAAGIAASLPGGKVWHSGRLPAASSAARRATEDDSAELRVEEASGNSRQVAQQVFILWVPHSPPFCRSFCSEHTPHSKSTACCSPASVCPLPCWIKNQKCILVLVRTTTVPGIRLVFFQIFQQLS